MHEATCSDCGKTCQVPFRPTGDKPVFCRDCFAKQGGGRELGRQAGERGARRDFGPAQVPMRAPSATSSTSFGSVGGNEIKRELESVNAKLERLITAVQALVQVQKQSVVPKSKKSVTKK